MAVQKSNKTAGLENEKCIPSKKKWDAFSIFEGQSVD
jgi:hypothetical protein